MVAAGLVGWVVDVSLLWSLHQRLGVPTAVAAAIGFTVAGVVNFVLNRRVFGAGYDHGQAFRYSLLFLLNLGLVSAAVPLLADLAGQLTGRAGSALVGAKALVTACLLPVNTIVYGHWVFRDRSVTPVGRW